MIYQLNQITKLMCTYLITGGASWLQPFSMMAPTIDLAVLVEVDEVHQELLAHAAHKAGWVPTHVVACP